MAATQVWAWRGAAPVLDLTGYDVEALDGSIGTVDEATSTAGENYLVVDTGPWIFGKRVLLPAGVVDRIDADEERLLVNRTRDEIKNAPEYDVDAGATESYRRGIASYYTAGEAGTSRSERSPRRGGSRQRKGSSSARGRKGTSRARRARASEGPTKEELYEQAKSLGIEGRSKMNKAQLARAVGRRRGRPATTQRRRSTPTRGRGRSTGARGKANPVEVQAFLEGVSYPTRKGDLVREAERSGASRTVRSTLERLPDERFEDPTEVSEAVGKLR
jgi:Protein of unknown function (DUF2795)